MLPLVFSFFLYIKNLFFYALEHFRSIIFVVGKIQNTSSLMFPSTNINTLQTNMLQVCTNSCNSTKNFRLQQQISFLKTNHLRLHEAYFICKLKLTINDRVELNWI